MRHVGCSIYACPLPAPAASWPAASDLTLPVIMPVDAASAALLSGALDASVIRRGRASHE